MQVRIPYWGEEIEISLPEKNIGEIIYPNNVKILSEDEIVTEALNDPFGFESFDEFIKGDEPILFIVNDATRPTPTARIINILWDSIKEKDVKFVIATGAHRAATEDEYIEIFGEHFHDFDENIFSHDAKNDDENVFIGKTKIGTEILFNNLLVDAKKIVFLTSVEPHYFAGYTGGAKSFLPGVSGFKTIEQNHELALKSTAKALVTKGNPVREDINGAFELIAKDKKIFSIQTVLNKQHRIYYCSCGETHQAFEAAAEKAKDVFSVEIRDKADIVVAVAPYPMDIDLYQSQKAIDNSKLAVNDNGILILVSSCRKGIGGETFMKLLREVKNPDEALARISDGYKLGYHKAAKLSEIMKWASIWSCTKLQPDLLEKIFIRGFNSLQKAINSAIEEKGNEKILFLMDASLTVPRIAPRLLHTRRFIYSPKEKYYEKLDINDLFAE